VGSHLLDARRISTRDKLVLSGLYLSKYDRAGLRQLGFETFKEAYNVIGYAMGSQPASIKNYRDEFDPLFSNRRKGWHNRPTRDYCFKIFDRYRNLDIESFTGLVKSFVGFNENAWSEIQETGEPQDGESCFAKRLITGLAAERYFISVQPNLPELGNYAAEDTTHLGCGYDFRLRTEGSEEFLAVEVKGLRERMGSLSMTPKEHTMASTLGDRFFLFVVRNFRESPFHEIYQNPLSGKLQFRKSERVTVHVSWLVAV
jgi:hypothetical protein